MTALITSMPPEAKFLTFSPPPHRANAIVDRDSLRNTFKFNPLNSEPHGFGFSKKLAALHVSSDRILLHAINAKMADLAAPLFESDRRQGILLSDVVAERPRKTFWRRKWSSTDLITLVGLLGLHVLCLFAPFQFNWAAFWVAVTLYVVTGLFGITLSYHRNLSHGSFKLPKWLEYVFAYCGVLAIQWDPVRWVSIHRYHHQFCDSERDPHSPTAGFWFSHLSWELDENYIFERCGGYTNAEDLLKQPFYKFIHKTYYLHPVALMGALLYALGGFPFIVWGIGVRFVWVFHITCMVNSVCHIWGEQVWNTQDHSRNNWWVALLSFGEGWHNNHHAFQYSARQGLEWWQFDPTWYVIRLLQIVGLATDVKLPNELHKRKMALSN